MFDSIKKVDVLSLLKNVGGFSSEELEGLDSKMTVA